jgi:hypothetical protein
MDKEGFEIEVDPHGEEPVDLRLSTLAKMMGEEGARKFVASQGVDPDELLEMFGEEELSEIDEFGFQGDIKKQQSKVTFSDIHLQTAIELSDQVESYEKVEPDSWGHRMNWGLVVSSITSCISFLDAVINEFVDDISGSKIPAHAERYSEIKEAGFDSDFQNLLGTLEEEDLVVWRHMSTLGKYQTVLALSEADRFDKGAMPYQDVYTLTRLRNYFIHFKPELYEYNQEEVQHSLGTALEGKYEENPLTDDYEPYFPNNALSHGCTEWGIQSSIAFTDEFFAKFGLIPSYRRRSDVLDFDKFVD